MPGHDQTDVRRRRLASAWLLIAVAASVAPATWAVVAVGQDAIVANWKGDEGELIRLKADRVQTWTEEGADWVLLEDQVEVGQGDVSLRSDRAVARIFRTGRADGPVFRVDLYVEGEVRDRGTPGKAYRELRTQLTTRAQVGLDSRVPGGRHALTKPPRALPLLVRAFPKVENKPTPQPQAAGNRPKPPARPSPESPTNRTQPRSGPIETSESRPPPRCSRSSRRSSTLPSPAPPAARGPSVPPSEPGAAPGLDALPFGSDVASAPPSSPPKVDLEVRPAQALKPPGFPDDFSAQPVPDQVPEGGLPPMAPNSVPLGPSAAPPVVDEPPTDLQPLPGVAPAIPRGPPGPPPAQVLPGSQRRTTIYPRGLGEIELESMPVQPDGTQIIIIRNGVNIQTRSVEQGIVDIEADSIVIWRRSEGRQGPARLDYNNQFVDNNTDPLEFYLEGHVVFRQDMLVQQGKSDQRTYQADRVYYDVRRDQLLALDAQVELFAPGLVTPLKIKSPRILQYHPMIAAANGQLFASSLAAMQAEQTVTTGSRFANPGYRFNSRSIDASQVIDDRELAKNDGVPFEPDDLTWMIDARQNVFFMGPVCRSSTCLASRPRPTT